VHSPRGGAGPAVGGPSQKVHISLIQIKKLIN
jgi:hypothetical protein